MIQDGPWNRYRQQAPAPAQPDRIYGAPKTPDALEMERFRLAQNADRRAQEDQDRQRAKDAAPKPAKALPEGAAKRLEDTIGLYANLKSAAGGFQDDYAGNTITGGLENTIQGLNSGFGTPGQRDWWANFRTLDNQIRNELFGATLTPSEQAAYAQTSINERMDPRTIRENLARREKVIRDALGRRTNYLKANGYNPEAIDALTGEFGADLTERAPASRSDEELLFNDEVRPVTGKRYSPDQEGQIAQAIRDGDLGQVLSLHQRFSGNPPDDATIQSARAAIDAVRKDPKTKIAIGYGGVDRSAQEQADRERYGENLAPAIEARKGAGVDATVRGLADTYSFGLADEIAAGAATLFGNGTMQENLQRERAIDEADRRVNAAPRFVGQLGGAIANPLGRGATTVAEITRAGATGGALYGFGSGDDLGSRAAGAFGGGVAGATGGYVAGRGSNALAGIAARRAEARAAAEPNALLQAADRQGVELMPADVGGPLVRRATAIAAQAPLSASPVIKGGQRVIDQSRSARDRIAAGVGNALDPEAAGDATRAGGQKFIAATRQQADRFYDRAEKLAGGAKITPTRTLEALDNHIAQLSEDPSAIGGSHLTALQKLRDAIGGGQLSVSGIRSMRSRLRQQFLDDGLRSSDFQRRVGEVVDAASEDLTANLTEQGLESAATAFRRADQFYRGRVEAIDSFLEPIIGKGRSGEQVVRALEDASKSNGRRLQGLFAALPNDERAAVQATVISRLGAKRGDAEAEDFSLDVFLSQWKAMTPRAKAALFPAQSREALDDLATIARGAKEAGSYANRSNTGSVIGGIATGGIATNVLWAPVSTSLALAGQYGAGKLLASPGFARWLARAPKNGNASALRTWINRIPQIPAVRGEIEQIQQRLLSSIAQQPRVAADEPDKSR